MAMGKKGAEEGKSRRWFRQGLATDIMRGWYSAPAPRQESLEGGGGKHFNLGHDEFEAPVGELKGGV